MGAGQEGIPELNEEKIKLDPRTSVMINPGTKHLAVDKVEALVGSVPPFDPTDTCKD